MRNVAIATPAVLLLLMTMGCKNENERLVEMAEQHATRQAEAQRQMGELHKQLVEGSRQLVEALSLIHI